MSKNINNLMTYWLADTGNSSLIVEIITQLALEGRGGDAIEFISKLSTEQRQLDVVVLQHAQLLLKQGDFTVAQQLLQQLKPQTDAVLSECVYLLALSSFLQNDHTNALKLLSDAAVKSTSNIKLQARIHYLNSRRPEALALLSQLINDNADAETLGMYALILVDEEKMQDALPYAEAALAIDAEQVDALIAIATITIQLQQFQLTARFTDKALAVMPGQGRIWSLHGQYLLQDGQLSQAETALATAIQLMPSHVGTQLLLGWSLWLQDKFSHAVNAFQHAVDMDRNFAESHAGLAVAQLKTGAVSEAKYSVTRALKLNPESIAAKYAQALLLEQSGQHGEATQQITEIMQASHYSGQYSNLEVVQRVLSERQGE